MELHDKSSDHAMHALTVQKQALQQQIMETDLALKELTSAKSAYKIVGGLMIATDVEKLREDLLRKKETNAARLSSLERHSK
jgi:chaperonin cofactor prefoldin